MKTKLLAIAALSVALLAAGRAAPLAATTAVHTKPDRSAPVITSLKAGTEPAIAVSALANTPAGWMAIELPGPFEGYVENKDLTKSLDVKAGAPIRLAPKADAGVLVVAEKGDKTTITGLRGKWTQLNLEKKLIAFIEVGATPGYLPPIATAPAGGTVAPAPQPSSPAPLAAAPVQPGVYGSATPGQAVQMVNLGDGGSTTLPRQYAGRFVSTRRPLTPRRPFDYALNDDAGRRYAYLDVSKLLLTDQIDNYVGRTVYVFGTARASADGKDMVIQVETLQLK
jgi:hypothetical protein